VDTYNWSQIKFLESTSNIQRLVKEIVGRKPSTKLASEISVCIQQGRMFFDTAIESPIEIKPLQLFYGMIGFAKALTLARTLKGLETFSSSHGIRDISVQTSSIEDLQLKILSIGTFQCFNDVILQFERIHYFNNSMPEWHYNKTASSVKLSEKVISIKDVLARIPGLEELYEKTFHEAPKTCSIMLDYSQENNFADLRIDDPDKFTDRESLKAIVKKWRDRYHFLNDWCLYEATHAWGNSIINFGNFVKKDIDDEFSEGFLMEIGGDFKATALIAKKPEHDKNDFRTILPPLFGGLRRNLQNIVEPFKGEYISEYSLFYLGMFLLSSLVRYRPQIWNHSISRSITIEKSTDDRALALIEDFMNKAIAEYPNMVIETFRTKLL
jgi:hypothetical protein